MNNSFFLLEKKIEEDGGKAEFLTKRKESCGVDVDSLETNYRQLQSELENKGSLDTTASKMLRSTSNLLGKYVDMILDEICDDVWFFLREIIQIPHENYIDVNSFLNQDTRDAKDLNYQIHPWESVYVFCYENNIPIVIDGFWGIDYTTIIASLHLHALFCRIREQRKNPAYEFNPDQTNHLYTGLLIVKLAIIMRENAILEETLKRWTFLRPIVLTSTVSNFENHPDDQSKLLTRFHDIVELKLPKYPYSPIQFKLLNDDSKLEKLFPYIRSNGISYDKLNDTYNYQFIGMILTRNTQNQEQIDRLIQNGSMVPFHVSMYEGFILQYRNHIPIPYVLYYKVTLRENIVQEDCDKMNKMIAKVETLETLCDQYSIDMMRDILL